MWVNVGYKIVFTQVRYISKWRKTIGFAIGVAKMNICNFKHDTKKIDKI
jgi:hypothetical protein